MKKSILAIATMAALMAGRADAEDSYLYWMANVNEAGYAGIDYSVAVKGYAEAGGKGDGTYLNLYWVDDGAPITSELQILGAPSSSVDKGDLATLAGSGWGFYAGLAANPSYGSYVIELWADGMGKVGEVSIDAANAAAFIAQNGIGAPASAPWTVAMTIPEPNSGLLLLLGGAVLALRRRKQEKKA